ncbi:MAG: hypothetical protein H5T80_15185 [Dietzia sp.]|nr:hypothetical protein [Dietzia sp.]OAH43639.1 hypothetical protein AYJ66_05290 [Dietzia cinnamea]
MLLAAGLALGFGATSTIAAWTDSRAASAEFSAGVFDLELDTGGGWSRTDQMVFAADDLFPGSTHYARALVRTSPESTVGGTIALRGEGSTDALASSLGYAVVVAPATPAGPPCDDSAFSDSADYVHGSRSASVAMTSRREVTSTHAVGPGGEDALAYCFRVRLSADAPSAVQGRALTHTWTWTARSVRAEIS